MAARARAASATGCFLALKTRHALRSLELVWEECESLQKSELRRARDRDRLLCSGTKSRGRIRQECELREIQDLQLG